jgi:hypothetical protein
MIAQVARADGLALRAAVLGLLDLTRPTTQEDERDELTYTSNKERMPPHGLSSAASGCDVPHSLRGTRMWLTARKWRCAWNRTNKKELRRRIGGA